MAKAVVVAPYGVAYEVEDPTVFLSVGWRLAGDAEEASGPEEDPAEEAPEKRRPGRPKKH
jgi:hypothetical protein